MTYSKVLNKCPPSPPTYFFLKKKSNPFSDPPDIPTPPLIIFYTNFQPNPSSPPPLFRTLKLQIIQTKSSIFHYLIDMNIYTQNLPVCNSGQYTYVTGLFSCVFVLQDLIDRVNSYIQRKAFQRNLLLIGF